MLDTKQLKAQGIRFGRSFQMALRTSVMFSADHPSLERPLEQSFNLLNGLLKEVGQLTIGFIDNQVLINNILTTEPGLAQLRKEFGKRGLAAFTFEPGLTLARYRKIVAVLSTPATIIDQAGGIVEYFELHEVQGGRIVTAARNQKQTETGDTLIESDSEAYIKSKQMAEEGPRDFMESLDALLESACLDPVTRNAALADLNIGDPNLVGQGYGVPIPMPNLIVDPNSTPSTDPSANGSGNHSGQAGNGSGLTGGSGDSDGHGGWSGNGGSGGPSNGIPSSGSPIGRYGHGEYIIQDKVPGPAGQRGGYRTFMELVDDSVSRSLVEEKGNPRKSYLALARILKESRVDNVLSYFPAEKREELRSLPTDQLAAEYVEESTLKLIAKQLTTINSTSADKYIVEEDVLRLLARSLQATNMADRMAFKLAKFFQEYSVPPHLQAKIQEELRWTALSPKQKYTRLMGAPRYDYTEFRRLIEYMKDLLAQREGERVSDLTAHYFEFLDDPSSDVQAEELSRSIEVIRTAKLGPDAATGKVIERIGRALLRTDLSELVHFQAANNLAVLAQSVSVFEAFDKVLIIAELLRQSYSPDPDKHRKCCVTSMGRMLSPVAIERLIEIYIANRTDAGMSKTAATILRYAHPAGTDAVLQHLIEEKASANRIALLRLIAQIGPACLERARHLLTDERWYVVRNMCNLLADLKDPELASCMEEPLHHLDVRVQQAAFNALVKVRAEGRALLIADCLTCLTPHLQEQALDELLYLRKVESVPGLEKFLLAEHTAPVTGRKALQVLSNIAGAEAVAAMNHIALSITANPKVRQSALEIVQRKMPAVQASVADPASVTAS